MMVNWKGFRNLRVQTVALDAHVDSKEIVKDGGIWESEAL